MLTKTQFDQLANLVERLQAVQQFAQLAEAESLAAAEYAERYLSALFKQMQAETQKPEVFELGNNFVIHK